MEREYIHSIIKSTIETSRQRNNSYFYLNDEAEKVMESCNPTKQPTTTNSNDVTSYMIIRGDEEPNQNNGRYIPPPQSLSHGIAAVDTSETVQPITSSQIQARGPTNTQTPPPSALAPEVVTGTVLPWTPPEPQQPAVVSGRVIVPQPALQPVVAGMVIAEPEPEEPEVVQFTIPKKTKPGTVLKLKTASGKTFKYDILTH